MLEGEEPAEEHIGSEDTLVGDNNVGVSGHTFLFRMQELNQRVWSLMALKWPYRTVSSIAWSPFAAIIRSPLNTAKSFFPVAGVITLVGGALSLLSFLVTPYGVFFFMLWSLHRLAVAFARMMAFPGHLSTVARQIETGTMGQYEAVEKRALATVGRLESALGEELKNYSRLVKQDSNASERYSYQLDKRVFAPLWREVDEVVRTRLQETLETLNLQESNESLCPAAAQYKIALQNLIDTLKGLDRTNINFVNGCDRDVLNFIDTFRKVSALEDTLAKEPKSAAGGKDDAINSVEDPPEGEGDDCEDSDAHWTVSISRSLRSWYKSYQSSKTPMNTVFNVSFFRVNALRQYNGELLKLTGDDGVEFEAVYFCPKDFASTTELDGPRGVLFCNPNGGMLEYVSHWVGYYHQRGLAVMLFNYRGYGRSKGYPVPTLLKKDGVVALRALGQKMLLSCNRGVPGVQAKIIVHGESMGGMVACYVANQCKNIVELLIVDRTFRNLGSAGRYLLAWWAESGMNYTTGWKTGTVDDYLQVSCPKVLTCDPEDKMIHNLSSLKSGVVERIILEEISAGKGWTKNLPQESGAAADAEGSLGTALAGFGDLGAKDGFVPIWKSSGLSGKSGRGRKPRNGINVFREAVVSFFDKVRGASRHPHVDPAMDVTTMRQVAHALSNLHNSKFGPAATALLHTCTPMLTSCLQRPYFSHFL
jgi:hypothetical protein